MGLKFYGTMTAMPPKGFLTLIGSMKGFLLCI
jgi:hypothetical protein